MNGLDFTQEGARFSYRGPTIRSIHPALGPELGGTLLTIDGGDLPRASSLVCHFGRAASSPAAWVSAERVQCVSPAAPLGVTAITVALARRSLGPTTTTHQAHAFEYQPAVQLRSIAPSKGPALGGTPVTIRGSHFSARSAELSYLVCRFDGITSEATRRNASALVCTAPATTGRGVSTRLPHIVAVQVANNVVDFSSSGAHYEYVAAMRPTALRTTTGPRDGGSLVTVVGGDFAPGVIRCHFGQARVVGSYVAADAVQCLAPPRGAGAWSRVPVWLSADDGAVAASGVRLHFVYHEEPTIRRVTPATGPEEGRTRVSVLGKGFANTASLKCRFGEVVVDAVHVSNELVNCTSPTHVPGVVAVEVSLDALRFSTSNASFAYHAAATVLGLVPSAGPTRGGTNVSLSGHGPSFSTRAILLVGTG